MESISAPPEVTTAAAGCTASPHVPTLSTPPISMLNGQRDLAKKFSSLLFLLDIVAGVPPVHELVTLMEHNKDFRANNPAYADA